MRVKKTTSATNRNTKRVLVAPLDWGLGHATRCIPVIESLLREGHEVWLAGDGPIRVLLQGQFPLLPFLPLQGYHIRYGRSAKHTFFTLLLGVPRFLRSIRQEHRWLKQEMDKHHFQAIISDNRYGLHHENAYSVFITHQLQVKAPLPWMEAAVRKLHFYFIEKFDHCWVPDEKGNHALAGTLSNPRAMPKLPTSYIGTLSRLQKQQAIKEEHLLLLLSGPEPQRTIFEQKLLQQALILKTPILLVRGLPGVKASLSVPDHITVHNYLDAAGLQAAMAKATLVISRSGYSTIMDLARMNKKSILVPTPAQPEQGYLARYMARQGYALWQQQAQLNLPAALEAAATYNFQPFAPAANLLTNAIFDLNAQLNIDQSVAGPAVAE